jgi:hypothetical protein
VAVSSRAKELEKGPWCPPTWGCSDEKIITLNADPLTTNITTS